MAFKILFIHGHMFHQKTWLTVGQNLAECGIAFITASQAELNFQSENWIEPKSLDLVLADLYQDIPNYDEIIQSYGRASHRLGLGPEMQASFTSLEPKHVANFNKYLAQFSLDNYTNAIKYLASCQNADILYEPCKPVQKAGVYHPKAPKRFSDSETYLSWHAEHYDFPSESPIAAILCYRGQLVEENAKDIDEVVYSLENKGIVALCLYCEGMASSSLPLDQRYPWLKHLTEQKKRLSAIFNFMAGRFLSNQDDAHILEQLDVPVIQLIRMHGKTLAQWEDDPMGISSTSLIYSLTQPEMSGVIEPTLGSVQEKDPDGLPCFFPVKERLDLICLRLKKWLALKKMANRQKRVTFVLHNSPCKGVEATAERAPGLAVFESLGQAFEAMAKQGYDFGGPPPKGQTCHEMIMRKKALSEFRWTTVEEIIAKGGDLHRMGEKEYRAYFNSLPKKARDKVIADWDEFPGPGMVYEENDQSYLVITGLKFGNIQVMIEPKRGCYGPKCHGEVCRILHDPTISPPHHWLATYKYIQDTSDVVVHFGAEGALEYLPGKRAALSDSCFPDISLGGLPNIQLYVLDCPGEGLMGKRRARALIVDHLTPAYAPTELDDTAREFETLLAQYQKARQMGEKQREQDLIQEITPLLKELSFVDENWDQTEFDERAELAGRQLNDLKSNLMPLGMHVLGTPPNLEEKALMLSTILRIGKDKNPLLQDIEKAFGDTDKADFEKIHKIITDIISGQTKAENQTLYSWIAENVSLLDQSKREIPQFLKALQGRFIAPGLGGSLTLGQLEALPTGRNFYPTDVTRLPTKAAYARGKQLADDLLLKYFEEENKFPESIGISLWSSDAFKSDGEIFCQILHLYGLKPYWEPDGRVLSLEVLPLDQLEINLQGQRIARPRVDVLIQTSGILRDMIPNFIELMDKAATMAGDLDEPDHKNFIVKHNQEKMAELRESLSEKLPEKDLKRLAGYRVYSSPAGSYGIGVGLALDASAWEEEKDLAEAYVNWGGVAYGAGESSVGVEAYQVFAGHLANIDVAYMKQYSPEYSLMDCGGYAAFQGGMALASKAVSGKRPKLYWADNDSNGKSRVRDLKESIEQGFRARILNHKWIERLKEHGYEGAAKATGVVGNLYSWSATTQIVDKTLFDAGVNVLIKDPENLAWLRKENPHALEELTRRLLEAQSRGLWQANEDDLAQVQTAALAVEGDMEDSMGDIQGEHQGATVDVLTRDQVEKWNSKWKMTKKL